MTEERLPTALWVDAHLRQLNLNATPYYLVNKGAYASGTVILKLLGKEQNCLVLQQQRDLENNLGWMVLFDGKKVQEKEADAFIHRAVERDPDLWVIEIEKADFENPFEGEIF